MDIKILVAAHKPYRMPEDEIYLPIHVGRFAKESIGYIGDDTGDNISGKNAYYCELTAIYWAWKNLKADYIGLAHYRRHFSFKKKSGKWDSVLNGKEAAALCGRYDVIVPNKRSYFIETNYSHYVHAHGKKSLDTAVDIIKSDYPEYAVSCDIFMNRTQAHMFNMFIMKRELFLKYCEWIFGVLFKVESKLGVAEVRIFGFLSELMLDIWLETNSVNVGECRVLFMEKQNWLIKGGRFVGRKLFAE